MNYTEFIQGKSQYHNNSGFDINYQPDYLFDFQKFLTQWSLKKGRSAIFADCGLGKTIIQLIWSQNILEKFNKPILVLTPLAVSHQTKLEGKKFGIKVIRSQDGKISNNIIVTNYERLHYFNPKDFIGIVCDESSILKSFDGKRKLEITEFMKKIPYRLLCTATAAPNDFMELGTSSEALGYLGFMDMLNRFFKNEQGNSKLGRYHGETVKWRLKNHAVIPFWQWVCSWARAVRNPSDIGFPNDNFSLPPLTEKKYMVKTETLPDGLLFPLPAMNLIEQREERRRTIKERCEKIAEIVNGNNYALVWCNLNDEGNLLEKIIPDAIQVSGKDTDDSKENKLIEFSRGNIRVLITKPKIGAWGLNFQHCNHVTFFPTHSYEQYYQGIRRCWRFGQKRPVNVDIVTTEGELKIMQNLKRKAKQADEMFTMIIKEMNKALNIGIDNNFNRKEIIPKWL